MERINLHNRSLQYHSHQEIEKILVWSAVQKFLENQQKLHLFSYISDIIITEKNITIHLTKPIVKNEFFLFKESLSNVIISSLSMHYDSHERQIKIL